MVKMRRADYHHPLEIVVKAVFILLIVAETNGDSRQDLYDSVVRKYILPVQSRTYNNADSPHWYYSSSGHKIQPYNKDESKDRIVFPQEEFVPLPSRFSQRSFSIANPPMCKHSTFCEDTPYYPIDLVSSALTKHESLKNLAIVDSVGDITQRIDVSDEAPLCVSTEQVIYPKTAETVGGSWLFIAQLQQQNFTQGVRIEQCVEESKPCRVIDGFASGYETKCKQRYIYRQLAAITMNGVTSELFRFPSSCCCTVTLQDSRRIRSPKQTEKKDTI
ncbi:hypothetical protein KPH14_007165 [Odynerus spinipes]|uniref:Spaetzle domain-containing protein n=1 Tax=Odynerus spinipes TaxID=1348599 RepID=A0AAD9VJ99_9HYME|nr:hypothetical protein KPH14_007165 [Odynerus spinipes]